MSIHWPDSARRTAFERWLAGLRRWRLRPESLRAASADASFRRYLRVDGAEGSYIVMDAPPAHEDVRPFMRVAELLETAGLNAPRVLDADVEHGFLLTSDLGQRLYLDALREASAPEADRLMRDAIGALVRWQSRGDATGLPPYDAALLRRELDLFPAWCVEREYGVAWSERQRGAWNGLCELLVGNALDQATVAVHRDWMPRNLMVATPNPGILDFQDAVRGPISYDIACLLRDAFISWDEEREIDWAARYWQAARDARLALPGDFADFWRQLEWMGLQRHLKVLGIFCRLKHRDGKPGYSADLPRFFGYARRVCTRYRELAALTELIDALPSSP